MDHSLCVGCGHPPHGGQQHRGSFADREKPPEREVTAQRLSVEQLHHDAGHSLVFDDVKD